MIAAALLCVLLPAAGHAQTVSRLSGSVLDATGLPLAGARQRAMLNLAAFHTDYTDLQVQTGIRPGIVDISNAAAATIRGLEIEGATRLGGAVQAGGHLAWLDATYDRYLAIGPGSVTGNVAGHSLNNAPEWSGRVWIDWTRPTGGWSAFSLRADSTWKTTAYFSPFDDSVQRQGSFGLLDISAQYGPPRHRWSVSIYARNLTGTEYITGTVGTPPTAFGGRPGDPRRLGVQLALER